MVILPRSWDHGGQLAVTSPAAPLEALHVLDRLRPADRAELEATAWETTNADRALRMTDAPVTATFWCEGEPAGVLFLTETSPGCWGGGLLGTPLWARRAVAFTRYCTEVWGQAFLRLGAHRVQMLPLRNNHESIAWQTRLLNGQVEGVLRRMGRRGEDFVMIGWTFDDVLLGSSRRSRNDHWRLGDRLHRAQGAEDQDAGAAAGGAVAHRREPAGAAAAPGSAGLAR